jgi:DNA-binding transcriptional LysR family regulator
MEFTAVETIKQCAVLGMGIAFLPGIVVESELAAGKLAELRWGGDDLSMRTQVAWHRDKWLSPAMQAFVALLRDKLAPQVASESLDLPEVRRLARPCDAS